MADHAAVRGYHIGCAGGLALTYRLKQEACRLDFAIVCWLVRRKERQVIHTRFDNE